VELEVIDIHDKLFSLNNRLDYIFMAHHSYLTEFVSENGIENELSGFYDLQAQIVKDYRDLLVALTPHIDGLSSLRVENN